MKQFFIFLLALTMIIGCSKNNLEGISENSVYHLNSDWENQDGKIIKLADLKGKVVVMVMIYTSCKTACPQLTADMRRITFEVGDVDPNDIRYVLVSIDPKKDTPEKMKEYLGNNKFDGEEWLFLRSSEDDTRELANVLAVKYKEISPIDFSHSNIISVFNKSGELDFQKEGTGLDINGTVDAINKNLHK